MKPGRKFVEEGASSCSDAELLAIILGSGGPGYSALDCATSVLERFGSLASIMDKPLRDLAGIRGVGAIKAIRIAAAFELSARILQHLERNE